tara:strand:- start:1904 stop:2317 length:414 start_codon:yes stop_codon:yes gene_type:complete
MEYFTLLHNDYWAVKVINTANLVATITRQTDKREVRILPDSINYNGFEPAYQLRLDINRLSNRLQLDYDIYIDTNAQSEQLKRMLLRWSPSRMNYPDFEVQEDEQRTERAILSFLADINDLDLYIVYEQYKKTMTWI